MVNATPEARRFERIAQQEVRQGERQQLFRQRTVADAPQPAPRAEEPPPEAEPAPAPEEPQSPQEPGQTLDIVA